MSALQGEVPAVSPGERLRERLVQEAVQGVPGVPDGEAADGARTPGEAGLWRPDRWPVGGQEHILSRSRRSVQGPWAGGRSRLGARTWGECGGRLCGPGGRALLRAAGDAVPGAGEVGAAPSPSGHPQAARERAPLSSPCRAALPFISVC